MPPPEAGCIPYHSCGRLADFGQEDNGRSDVQPWESAMKVGWLARTATIARGPARTGCL